MNTQTVAIIIQESTKIIGEVIRNGGLSMFQRKPEEPKQAKIISPSVFVTEDSGTERVINYSLKSDKATAVPTGCLPCAIGHLGTCSGLLNEATRFARKDGMSADEVIDRVNMCLDELNTFERVDLRPEMIDSLPESEKELARQALNVSRNIRHSLEKIETMDPDGLEHTAAEIQTVRKDIGRKYLQGRIKLMGPEEKERVRRTLLEKLQEVRATADEDEETEEA